MTVKGFYKLIVHPRTFFRDYEKKLNQTESKIRDKEEKEKITSLISPVELNFAEIKSLTTETILTELVKYMRIYGFSENNFVEKEAYYEYGIDIDQFRIFLVLLHSLSSNGLVSISLIVKSKRFTLNTSNISMVYDKLKNINSFFMTIENMDGEQYKILFQIADIVDEFLIFRTNNTLYKKQRFLEEIPNYGLIDLKSLNQHNYPSQLLWNKPVDVVYTWVNSEDENWKKMILEYKSEEELDFDRYQNFDELKYSLRSIDKHIPWVNNIYIVTNCAKPSWLDENSKIHWIWHEDIFPNSDYLPTFSSHAIESCLHKINGLSEYFLYFNDDVFLMKNMEKTDFFKANDCSISFMESYGAGFYPREVDDESYINAALNGKRLLEEKFNISPVQFHKHVPHVLRKSILEEMEEAFEESYKVVRLNKFREKTDISTISFLYHHYSYFKKESVRESRLGHLIRHTNYRAKTRAIRQTRPHFICINDGGGSSSDSNYKEWMLSFLEKYYPLPAIWEKNENSEM